MERAGLYAASDDAGKVAAEVVRALDLQTVLPHAPPPIFPSWSLPPFLWWIAIGIAAAFLAYLLVDALRNHLPVWGGGRAKSWREAEEINPQVVQAAMSRAALTADEMASEQRFVEAMHLLLLQSLAEMRRRLDVSIADSLTSREILQAVSLPERGRAALKAIIESVELSYFGARSVDAADYRLCRDRYEELSAALGETVR